MPGKLKLIFADFLKTARKLWLEMMGALFLTLAVVFLLNTVTEYRKASAVITSWHWRTVFSVFGSGFFAVLMLGFGLQSFWKARKIQ